MDYQRHFLDETGSDDSCGRALWALGYIIWRPPRDAYRSLAFECFQKALPHVRGLNLRGKALAMLGLAAYLRCYQGDESVTALLRECADHLLAMYQAHGGRRLALVRGHHLLRQRHHAHGPVPDLCPAAR